MFIYIMELVKNSVEDQNEQNNILKVLFSRYHSPDHFNNLILILIRPYKNEYE